MNPKAVVVEAAWIPFFFIEDNNTITIKGDCGTFSFETNEGICFLFLMP